MGRIISVAGKGGVGKTTIASLMVAQLCKTGSPLLAVDADPNYNLGDRLGVSVTTTIGSIREELMKTKDELPQGVSKHELVDYQIRMAIQEEDCFDLLTMGRQEGPGCYCYINSVLRSFIDALVSRYDYVIIDNEAGLEHLSRRTTMASDFLLIISDISHVSLRAAGRIANLADEMELKIGRKILLLNRTDGAPSDSMLGATGYNFDSIRTVRSDSAVEKSSAEGTPIMEIKNVTPAMEDLRRLLIDELGLARLFG